MLVLKLREKLSSTSSLGHGIAKGVSQAVIIVEAGAGCSAKRIWVDAPSLND